MSEKLPQPEELLKMYSSHPDFAEYQQTLQYLLITLNPQVWFSTDFTGNPELLKLQLEAIHKKQKGKITP